MKHFLHSTPMRFAPFLRGRDPDIAKITISQFIQHIGDFLNGLGNTGTCLVSSEKCDQNKPAQNGNIGVLSVEDRPGSMGEAA